MSALFWPPLGFRPLVLAAIAFVVGLAPLQLSAQPQSTTPTNPSPSLANGGPPTSSVPTLPSAAPNGGPVEMKARMDQLEKQNQLLLKSLEKIQAQLAAQPSTASVPPAPVSGAPNPNQPTSGLNQSDVQKLVGDYLNSREQQKQSDDAAMKLRQSSGGFVVGKNLGMTSYWNNGMYAESEDKAFRIHVGGRTQLDYVGYQASNAVQYGAGGVGQVKDGVNFRRARLEVDGTLWENIDFFAEYEFLGNTFNTDNTVPATDKNVVNTPGPTDLWATITNIPLIGNVRVGNMKPPISLEHLTSSRWLDFMERSFAFDAYIGGTNNGFIPGIQVFNWTNDERITWALGAFKNNQTVLGWNVGGGEMDFTGRVTWLPVYEDNGRCLVHLGLGASNRGTDDGVARLRARTLLRNGPFTLQTRLLDVTLSGNNQSVVVPELAVVLGPWSFQAEYFGSWVSNSQVPAFTGPKVGTTFTQSAYVEALYFLTGENRPWIKTPKMASGSAPGRIIPFKNFYSVPGEGGRHLFSSGAWQVGARFSWIDLNNQAQQTGSAYDVTLVLNWFLNPNMKFQWNYDYVFRDALATSSGPINGVGFRFAMDF